MTKGPFAYDFGDLAKKTPLLPMYTLGHDYGDLMLIEVGRRIPAEVPQQRVGPVDLERLGELVARRLANHGAAQRPGQQGG